MRNCTMEIMLDDLRFFGYHGVFEQETVCGNEFAVDLKVEYPCHIPSFFSDIQQADERLEDTISYADLYKIVAEEMNKPRKLLETLAVAIAERILKTYPILTKGCVKITKLVAPIGNIDGKTAVKLNF